MFARTISAGKENLTTCKKKVETIDKVFRDMEYVLWEPSTIHIFTDHMQFHYVFAPLAL